MSEYILYSFGTSVCAIVALPRYLHLHVISDASVHHVFVISGKAEVHPIILFKNVTLQISNFISVIKLIKNFPIWFNVNFESFIAINNIKSKENRRKINITPYGKMFIS